MSAAAPAVTRCPCGDIRSREASRPCPNPDCSTSMGRPVLVSGLPSRADRSFPHTNAVMTALGFVPEVHDG